MIMNCNLCGSSLIARLFDTGGCEVVKCRKCGLVFLPPRVATDDIYSEDYFVQRKDYFFNDGVTDASGEESAHISDFREGLAWIETYERPPGRLLDIGCAMGAFLSIARDNGWQCHGVERSAYAASVARQRHSGIEIFAGRLRDKGYPSGFFDVITMWDVIEHLPDPLEELKEVRRILKPGGLLLVNTPNEKALLRGMAGLIYKYSGGRVKYPVARLYHEFHLYYLDTETLALYFEKAGMNVVAMTKKVMPISRGRSSAVVKLLRQGLSFAERLFHSEYELFFIVRK